MSTDPIRRWLMSWLQQCLLRRAPQDDPLSYSALQWSIAGYALLDLVQAGAGSDWSVAVGMTVLDILVMVLFVWAVLLLGRKVRSRCAMATGAEPSISIVDLREELGHHLVFRHLAELLAFLEDHAEAGQNSSCNWR